MQIDLNQAVFTTRSVLEENSKIVYVVHDSEGEWQFFGVEDNISEEDARVISLGEILKIEPSLKQVLWIPAGMKYWRDLKTNEWHACL